MRQQEIAPGSILAWLQNASVYPKCYFASRDGNYEFGGIGQGATQSELPKFIAGWFDPGDERPAPEWARFPKNISLTPQIIVERRGEKYFATASTWPEPGLPTALMPASSLTAERTKEVPTREAWRKAFSVINQCFMDGAFIKVVLARRVDLNLKVAADPISLLARVHQTNCYSFLLDYGTAAFLGSSPERLLKSKGQEIESEILCGTAKVGDEPGLFSAKNAHEHEIVRRELIEHFETLTSEFRISPKPCQMPAGDIIHLMSKIGGTLRPSVTGEEALKLLHPTAALCGYPREIARNFIRTHEPFVRGLYGGYVGVRSSDEIECCVAIRSLLIEDSTLSLFSGVGIVPDSNAEDEWTELDMKIQKPLELLR